MNFETPPGWEMGGRRDKFGDEQWGSSRANATPSDDEGTNTGAIPAEARTFVVAKPIDTMRPERFGGRENMFGKFEVGAEEEEAEVMLRSTLADSGDVMTM